MSWFGLWYWWSMGRELLNRPAREEAP
jgi:hypothetical protein